MTAFVILHYRAIDTTRSCVKSIRALAGDKHIVIVDNASPDGTGKQLAEEFAASPDVTVLLHGKNDGFARGSLWRTLSSVQPCSVFGLWWMPENTDTMSGPSRSNGCCA